MSRDIKGRKKVKWCKLPLWSCWFHCRDHPSSNSEFLTWEAKETNCTFWWATSIHFKYVEITYFVKTKVSGILVHRRKHTLFAPHSAQHCTQTHLWFGRRLPQRHTLESTVITQLSLCLTVQQNLSKIQKRTSRTASDGTEP